ncbi:putative methyltransferase-domain-containing protein [Crucibulum laeve]|uniref:Putative methyltransferase-domain-containing protein n=1 Tax=Crucibulum laeve TaxID=68775 RepID=A0A5C3M107_9AGAR|nr:putative methyltransferase-domain-containing protein [Crucibulum laeve]
MAADVLYLPPPSLRLPSIRNIYSFSAEQLTDAINYLRLIYNPEIRGTRRRRHKHTKPTKPSNEILQNSLESLRIDTFERSYAIRWLTALISQVDESESGPRGEALIQNAASLLALCAGTASAGIITRDFVFTAAHLGEPSSVAVKLRDTPLDNADYGSVGAQTWGGACVMSEMIVEEPGRFGLECPDGQSLRILELGAGTGLVSLTVAKLMQALRRDDQIEIVATDYYPSVLANLQVNVHSNDVCISTHSLDWSLFSQEHIKDSPFDEPFDVVLGADIIYERDHAVWIKSCLALLLRKPSSVFHLIIPLRATHTLESNTIEEVFTLEAAGHKTALPQLIIKSKETIICDAEGDKDGDEVEYAYYRIGWDRT